MAWWQLTVECTGDELEQVEDCLLALGALSLTIGDAQDEPIYEPLPGDTPLWSRSTITGLFDQSQPIEALYDRLVMGLPPHLAPSIKQQELADQVWERVFLDRYHPVRFGHRLWVVPSWHQPPDPAACNIILDPGIAFGTGGHPTTALCLEFMDGHPPQGKSVIDYGCGSGILAIAASRLGATALACIDLDPQALESTARNARRNGLDPESLNISLPEDMQVQHCDYLVANILSGPLVELQARFASLTTAGAQLLLSGILPEQADAVHTAYQRHFDLDAVTIRDGWCRITGTRNSVH